MKTKFVLMNVLILFIPVLVFAQGTINGNVKDARNRNPLPDANVFIENEKYGSSTGLNGKYVINGIPAGTYKLTASFMGYAKITIDVTVKDGETSEINFDLNSIVSENMAIEILADRAKHRETPVAFTDMPETDLKYKTASRDLPMVLNGTPGVYATMQGGGSGDSRINIRGFDQANIAVMVNGVPVNDMEHGKLYWSNWDGLADITRSIQIQRGLGASNLALASVGGTMNIITSAANTEKSGMAKQEIGHDGFKKTTLLYNTGRLGNGLALSASIARKSGNGYINGTWVDAWAYFFTMNKLYGNHSFDFTFLGAPQQHGERSFSNRHTIEDWDENFNGNTRANSGYNGRYDGTGSGWGYVSEENYEKVTKDQDKPSSLDGLQKLLFGSIQQTKKLGDKRIINNRTNYYHKPVYNLNWYWKISEATNLSSVLYGSNGFGGGTGTLNARGKFNGQRNKYIDPEISDGGFYNWDDLINYNSYGTGTWEDYEEDENQFRWNYGKPYDPNYSANEKRSKYIIRASVNSHNWYGAISTLSHKINDRFNFKGGVDLRTYKGIHYREVVNLLGGNYFVDDSNLNDTTDREQMKRTGDKVEYDYEGYNKWYGAYGQLEYVTPVLSAFTSGAVSSTNYKRKDFFEYKNDDPARETGSLNFSGYAFKIGANYNLNESMNIYGNTGVLSIAPKFREVFLNYNNTVNPDAKNEKVSAFEAGYGFSGGRFGINVNYYYTLWKDKSLVKYTIVDDAANIANISGLDAKHTGIEIDFKAVLHRTLKLNGSASLANWKWKNDVIASVTPDNNPAVDPLTVNVYSKDIHVGNAPQKQLSGGLLWSPLKGLKISPVWLFYADHYADFDPTYRTDSGDRTDSYKLDSYNLFNVHASYRKVIGRVPVTFSLHLLNAFDEKYISDAVDGDDHTIESMEVFYGFGRRFNTGVSVEF